MAANAKVLAPLGTFVVIAAVGAAVALTGTGSGSHTPRSLRLAAGGSFAQPAIASDAKSNGEYQLTGSLPAGKPADAPAWSLSSGTPDGALLDRLATALHTKASRIGVSTRAGQSWSYSQCGAPDAAVSSDGTSVSCGYAVAAPPPGGPVVAPLRTITPAGVRTVVKPVFDVFGLDLDKAVITGGQSGSATLSPTVDGLETTSFGTRVDVSSDGAIQDASGWLGTPTKADTYPLITAQEAYEALPSIIHPDVCQLPTDGSTGCVAPPVPQITGAHLGLTSAPLQAGGQVLVPAWLFDVKGATEPLAQIAVEPKYRGAPEPQNAVDDPAPVGSAGSSSGSSGSGTTAVPPAPPVGTYSPGVPPVQSDPAQPSRHQLTVYAAHRGKTPNELVVTYGESGSCPETDVTHDQKEDGTTVYVVLSAAALKPGIACTEDFHEVSVTIELQAPLGDRKVVDANSSKPVPVT